MDTSSWKYFTLNELFDVRLTKGDIKADDVECGDVPLISSGEGNNGVVKFITRDGDGKADTFPANALTLDMFCHANYQPRDFFAVGHGRVNILMPKFNLTKNIGLFICAIINQEVYRFSYGRAVYSSVAEKMEIKLPSLADGSPDWQYMENFVKDQIIPQLPKKAQKVWLQKYDTKPQKQEKMQLNTQEWKWFLPSDIFTEISIAPSSDLNSLELDSFGVNYLSRAVVNNGYECKVKRDESKVTRGNFISVVMVGVPSFAFYQKNDVICSQNILVLRYPAINQYNALFLCAILQKDGFRYSYGRTLSKANFLQTKIKLPVTPSGTPDWQFMEDYIKSLPFSKNLEPSDPNEVVDELMEVKKRVIEMQNQLAAQQQANITNYGTVNIYEK